MGHGIVQPMKDEKALNQWLMIAKKLQSYLTSNSKIIEHLAFLAPHTKELICLSSSKKYSKQLASVLCVVDCQLG